MLRSERLLFPLGDTVVPERAGPRGRSRDRREGRSERLEFGISRLSARAVDTSIAAVAAAGV
jgi:hypothetical protein